MLELFNSGLVSLWLQLAGVPRGPGFVDPVSLMVAQEAPWLVLPGTNDPLAIATVQSYLQGLKKQGLNTNLQGIWLQSGPLLLASNQGNTPLPAASLTKIATSLVALDVLGPDHQFETLVSASGPIRNGVLEGDLIVQGGGDPLFIWEEAIVLGNSLHQSGIKRVTGNLVIVGNFFMNYGSDPEGSGKFLKQALNSQEWDSEILEYYNELPPGTAKPRLVIQGQVRAVPAGRPIPGSTLLLRRRSLPLSHILKIMNIHSNNFISETLAEAVGGAQFTAERAAALAGVPPEEVRLVNGSGLGKANQISPRAVCAMLGALQRHLAARNLTLADFFPVSGLDGGTLEDRHIPTAAVVKTGTLNEVSALAGVLPTRDRGLVWFAIINRGTEIENLRVGQDHFLQQLSRVWGLPQTTPMAIAPTNLWFKQDDHQGIGAATRSEIVFRGG